MHLEALSPSSGKRKQHLFRFEECWLKDERCEAKVRNVWERVNLQCIEKLAALKVLDREFEEYRSGCIRKEIVQVEAKLKDEKLWSGSPEDTSKYKDLERKHDDLLLTEETIW